MPYTYTLAFDEYMYADTAVQLLVDEHMYVAQLCSL
jgi:hypothetical protein